MQIVKLMGDKSKKKGKKSDSFYRLVGFAIVILKLSIVFFFHEEIYSLLNWLASDFGVAKGSRVVRVEEVLSESKASRAPAAPAAPAVVEGPTNSRISSKDQIDSKSVDGSTFEAKSSQKKKERKIKNERIRKEDPLYLRSGVYNFEPKWGFNGELKYIDVVPNIKIPIKWDRRIIFPSETLQNLYDIKDRMNSQPSSEGPLYGEMVSNWEPPELATATSILKKHPIFDSSASQLHDLDEMMTFLSASPSCSQTPIFLTMATIGNELYWQLVENFVYTLVKYKLSDCALIVCVSDALCMRKCGDYSFPCFNYQTPGKTSSMPVMEQIAILKLQHIPKALSHGVDVFMLDLDVGFIADPHHMLQVYRETPMVDIFVQEDFIYLMNRTTAGWKTWYTEPLPNIGMFLCRGNNKTAKVFDLALQNYLTLSDPEEKAKPGIDQKKVLSAIQVGRGTFALKFAYFTTSTAPLMDKFIKQHGNVYELGGELMLQALRDQHAMAMHTTCYEKSTKVMGLKASSAFWNPRYYDPLRRTLTKQLLFTSEQKLREEVQALVWLAVATGRSLILPNLLGNDKTIHTIAQFGNRTLWPGFRIANIEGDVKVTVLEPAYYWRLHQDYSTSAAPVPAAKVVYFAKGEGLGQVRDKLQQLKDYYRIILHPKPTRNRLRKKNAAVDVERTLLDWADHSIGDFGRDGYEALLAKYRPLPSLEEALEGLEEEDRSQADIVLQGVRNCRDIFGPPKGNSTCFQICE